MFKDINIERKYRSDINNIPENFLIPLLSSAKLYKRAVGFFSTTSLLNLSVGLAAMAKNGGKIEIVCSPKLSEEDIAAINCGYKTKEKAFVEALDNSFTEPINKFEEERLNMVATMVANEILDFKIAFMETDMGINIYHEKIAIAYDECGNRVSFTGSMNDSENGLLENFESFVVFCDWKSDDQKLYIEETENDFERLWNNNTNKVKIIPFPEIIIEKLLKYQKPIVNYEIDKEQYGISIDSIIKKTFIEIPEGKKLLDYQKEAIHNWKSQNYIGIYDMATGTGKTYTALGSIALLASELENNIAVFILCPYVHLVGQWEEDLVEWGTKPIIAHSQSRDRDWYTHLVNAQKRFRLLKKPYICITTNDTFSGDKVQKVIDTISDEMNVLIVVDEAHNVGAIGMSRFLNENIKYRLALSATIERYRDMNGTKVIFDYFKERCIEYPLERAIEEGNLCQYEYHVIYSFLSAEELNKYAQITKELRKYLIYENGKTHLSKAAQVKLFERKRILAGASDKIDKLEDEMRKYKNEKYILIYCGATTVFDEELESYEKQIIQVNNMLEKRLEMSVHKFTAEEDISQRTTIKDCFSRGMYQVITAIKCLDEGVNIPNIRTAFILSSSQNPKEFIQRRGRLLRKAKGKTKAVIYDFVTLPRKLGSIRPGDFELDRGIVVGEMLRIKEFAEASLNIAEGLNVIDEIQDAYGNSIDLEEEIRKLKEGEINE